MLVPAAFFKRVEVILLFSVIFLIWLAGDRISPPKFRVPQFKNLIPFKGPTSFDKLGAENATLGFEVIIAVSSEDPQNTSSWRQQGLMRAANRTGLHIQIPKQNNFTFKQVKELTEGDGSHPGEGQALAWLGHTSILQQIVESNTASALILEDDADWDVSLRSTQILPISDAIRNLTKTASDPIKFPYGIYWDVLWLGHCGNLYSREASTNIPLPDPGAMPVTKLKTVWHPNTYPETLPEFTRDVHYTNGPLCTFAYAVTPIGARKILKLASTPGEAFDVMMHHGCRLGKLDCLSVTPEVIHHQRIVGGDVESLSQAKEEGREERIFTHNVRHSARCNWDRWEVQELTECWPTSAEWKEFNT